MKIMQLRREDSPKILELEKNNAPEEPLYIKLEYKPDKEQIDKFKKLFNENIGSSPVYFEINNGQGKNKVKINVTVHNSEEFRKKVNQIVQNT